MARSDDIKSLTQDIIASYEARMNALGQLAADTRTMLEDFQKESGGRKKNVASLLGDFRATHEEMGTRLKEDLAKVRPELGQTEAERTRQAQADIKERVGEVTSLLSDFRAAHEEMGNELRAELAKVMPELGQAEAERLRQAQAEIKERVGQVASLLSDFRTAHEGMGNQLTAELARVRPELGQAEAERVKQAQAEIKERVGEVRGLLNDFRAAHQGMTSQVTAELAGVKPELSQAEAERAKQALADIRERVATVGELLGEFRTEGQKAAAAWQQLGSIMQAKRGTAAPSAEEPAVAPGPAETAPQAEAGPEASPAEEERATAPEPADTAPATTDLSERVLSHLADHPDGARMVELEAEFGVARIQMARVLNSLMDEGKVEKRDMLYFAA